MTAIERDAVIVGGGVVGAAAAYYLARAGRRVLLVERGVIAGEASGRNGGHISPTVDGAWAHVGRLALELWPSLAEEIGRPTEYHRGGGLHLVLKDDPIEPEQLAAYRRARGFAAETLTPAECLRLLPGLTPRIKGGVFAPRSGHANPILTTKGLAKAAEEYGATIWTHTAVTGIAVRDGAVVGVETTRGYVAAPVVVNAAGAWAAQVGRMAGVVVPVIPRRIQILLSERMPPLTRLVWTGHGVYARQAVAGQLHFGAGGPAWDPAPARYDHTVTAPTMQRIARRMLELMPGLADTRILRAWAGVIGPGADGVPILEACATPRGLIVAAGWGGNGFGTGPAVGRIVCDLVLTGRTAIDIAGLSLARFAERAAWAREAFAAWWDSAERGGAPDGPAATAPPIPPVDPRAASAAGRPGTV
jgi:sarcosine oxidase subunit beta